MLTTNRALELTPQVKKVLNEVEQLLQPSQFDPTMAELTVRIACTDYAMRAVIMPFLHLLKIQAPKIKVAVLVINESIVQNQLKQRQIDFALVTPNFQAPDIHAKILYDERYICVVRHDHPIAQQSELTLEQFCQLEQALISYHGGSFSGVTDKALKAMGLQRNVSLSVQNFIVLPELLEQRDLLAVVPERLITYLDNLKRFEPSLKFKASPKH